MTEGKVKMTALTFMIPFPLYIFIYKSVSLIYLMDYLTTVTGVQVV